MNANQFIAPSLEELYIDLEIVAEEASRDISFIFTGVIDPLIKLRVLWIKALKNKLLVENIQMASLSYRKLYLNNVEFKGAAGQKLFDNTSNLEDLTLKKCIFENISEDIASNFKNLNSLSLGMCKDFINIFEKQPAWFSQLRSLSFSRSETKGIFELLSNFKQLSKSQLIW